jgi:A/G-specific adenine glycosylase
MPTTVEGLLELPGIGRYTASAIASIAYGVPVPVVDGNVCRVLARLRGIGNHVKAPALKDKYGWELAQQLVDDDGESHPGDLNQALMELGATYCAPSGSGTDPEDPLVGYYWSTQLGYAYAVQKQKETTATSKDVTPPSREGCPICASDGVDQTLASLDTLLDNRLSSTKESFTITAQQCGHAAFPQAPPKKARREEVLAVAVLSKEDGSYLMVKRPKTGLLAGQWEFPAALVWSSEGKPADGQIAKNAPSSRRKALDGLVAQIFTDDSQTKLVPHSVWQKRSLVEEPLEHIFSHVRHTMWLEEKSIGTKKHDTLLAWTDSTDREIRWMNQADMTGVGITSGVKKILKAVARKKVKPIKRQRTK